MDKFKPEQRDLNRADFFLTGTGLTERSKPKNQSHRSLGQTNFNHFKIQ
jgi:hypothetical protein